MQAGGCAESAPSGEDGKKTEEPQAASESPAKADDDWGKFYSMPPKWKKDTPQSKSGLTDENVGHRLASLLRYHLDEVSGINTDDEGWVQVDDIVANADEVGLSGCTAEDLVRVVENNEHSTRGKRFESDGAGRVKATYRHPPKDRRGDRWDNWRDSRGARGSGSRRRGGYGGWHSWDNYNWRDGWQENGGDETWAEWKKPGFSPSPDDVIVKETSWAEVNGKSAAAASKVKAATSTSSAVAPAGGEKAACEWEQWFTPDSMEMYFYNVTTEEAFFPGDAADTEEKGWCRYVETDGDRQGLIYWWHEATGRSFFEEDTQGDEEAA